MAAGAGRLVRIAVSDGGSPASYTTIAGMQSKTMTINNEQVDITDDDNAPWRVLLASAGLRSVSISGNGVNKDDANGINRVRDLALDGTLDDFRVTLPSGDTIEGQFQVASYEESGDYNGANLFTMTLESGATATLTEA